MYPSLELEAELLGQFEAVIGVDEVGRGALAGPVAVGAARITRSCSMDIPNGLRDSKLISEAKRSSIAELTRSWLSHSVGYSTVGTIEERGITKALELAAVEAIKPLLAENAVILLDGSHNWLASAGLGAEIRMRTKADRDCAAVSAAALIAKTDRDGLMQVLHEEFPDYGWSGNKGYASESHIKAIQSLGPSIHHRTSWLGKILGGENQLF